eukprot:CAMPEP_0197844690 /NCGR_PEP_ID=MMETSP1438-20131217/1677_1 /TAXON_ID=1461541 /ORGANISM="Pterosperma sp., Strain CCMP1384" /LENGTH=1215 /DNA_ID=CAMNT_0043455627 /DNA_START=755 /DNA_END=4399 /DNA_ORIENTATION=-
MPARQMSDSELAAMLHREMNSSRRVTAARGKTAAALSNLVATSTARARARGGSGSCFSGTGKPDSDSEAESDSDAEGTGQTSEHRQEGSHRNSPATTSAKDNQGSRKTPSSEGIATSLRSTGDDSKEKVKLAKDHLTDDADKHPDSSRPSSKLAGDWKVDKAGRPTTTAGRQALKAWKETTTALQGGREAANGASNAISSYSKSHSPEGSECGLADSQRPSCEKGSAPAEKEGTDTTGTNRRTAPSQATHVHTAANADPTKATKTLAEPAGKARKDKDQGPTQQPGSGKNFTQLCPPIPSTNLKPTSFEVPESVYRSAAIYMRGAFTPGTLSRAGGRTGSQPSQDPAVRRQKGRPPRPNQKGEEDEDGTKAEEDEDGASYFGSQAERENGKTEHSSREPSSSRAAAEGGDNKSENLKTDEEMARELHLLLNEGRSKRRVGSSQALSSLSGPPPSAGERKGKNRSGVSDDSERESGSCTSEDEAAAAPSGKATSSKSARGGTDEKVPRKLKSSPGGDKITSTSESGKEMRKKNSRNIEPSNSGGDPGQGPAKRLKHDVGSPDHYDVKPNHKREDAHSTDVIAKPTTNIKSTSRPEKKPTVGETSISKNDVEEKPAGLVKKEGIHAARPRAFLPSAFNTPLSQKATPSSSTHVKDSTKPAIQPHPSSQPSKLVGEDRKSSPPSRSDPAHSAAPPVVSPTTAAARHAEMAARAFAAAGISPPPATERAMRAAALEEQRRAKAKAKAAARVRVDEEKRQEAEQEAAARARAFSEVAAKLKAEAEAADRAKAEAEAVAKAKAEAEAAAKAEAEAAAKAEALAKAKAEAAAKAKAEAAAKARAKAEAEAAAKAEAAARARAEAAAKAKAEAKAAKAKAEAEAADRAKAEAAARARAEHEARLSAAAAQAAATAVSAAVAAAARMNASPFAVSKRMRDEEQNTGTIGANTTANQNTGTPRVNTMPPSKRHRQSPPDRKQSPAGQHPVGANGSAGNSVVSCTVNLNAQSKAPSHKPAAPPPSKPMTSTPAPQALPTKGLSSSVMPLKKRFLAMSMDKDPVPSPKAETKPAVPVKTHMSHGGARLAYEERPLHHANGNGNGHQYNGGGFSDQGLIMRGIEALTASRRDNHKPSWKHGLMKTSSTVPNHAQVADAHMHSNGYGSTPNGHANGHGVRTGRRKPNRGGGNSRKVWGEGLGLAGREGVNGANEGTHDAGGMGHDEGPW